MALWMTGETGIALLAAAVLFLLCAGILAHKRGGSGRAPALLLLCAGILLGFFRMEAEEMKFLRAARWLSDSRGSGAEKETRQVYISGRIAEIEKTDFGYRVTVDSEQEAGRVFCYLKEADGLKLGQRIGVEGEGETPEPARNPGGFNYRLYCFGRGVGGIVQKGEATLLSGGRIRRIPEALRLLKLRFLSQLDAAAGPKDSGILKAVLLGEKSGIEDSVYEQYRKNGISHLLAISGLHVSIIGMGFWKVLRKWGLGYGKAGFLAGAFLFCYGMMAGFGPSVARAVTMMFLSFLAGYLGRTYDLPSAMCIPAMGLLLMRPYLLTQAGFQLSFLAVGAVVWPGRLLGELAGRNGVMQSLSVSAAIQLVTLPCILYHSFEVPVYAVFLNLLVIPPMALVVISGLCGLTVSFVSLGAGTAAMGGAHFILEYYLALCGLVERFPGAALTLGRPAFWQIAAYYGCLGLGAAILGQKERGREKCDQAALRRKQYKKTGLGVCIWAAGILFLFPVPRTGLSVVFLDVGQGDGIFMEWPDGRTVLVDCGSSGKKNLAADCLAPFLKSRGITHVDTVAVTHGDKDHISAVRQALMEPELGITVGELVLPAAGLYGKEKDAEVYRDLKELTEKQGGHVRFLSAGEVLSDGEVKVYCLSPPESLKTTDRNEESLVFLMVYGDFSMMLTGDMGIDGEERLLDTYVYGQPWTPGKTSIAGIPVTVLKAGHHGSKTSTGEEFLSALSPGEVIFSYGEGNRYGHPSPEVLERVEAIGARRWETARQGAILLWTDGRWMTLKGFVKQ